MDVIAIIAAIAAGSRTAVIGIASAIAISRG
jgi:hypothetical protein